MNHFEEICAIICNEEESRFYAMGEYFVESPIKATKMTSEKAEWFLSHRLFSDFQAEIFTKFIMVKTSIERI